jgi:hypothetical protein
MEERGSRVSQKTVARAMRGARLAESERAAMAHKNPGKSNEYRCVLDINQNGKYCVRIRASYGRRDWVLPIYFLASSFDRAMKKLEQALQFLQGNEEKLWFWGVDRSDDPNLAGEMIREAGLRLDRRSEFPRKCASVVVPPERPVPAFLLAPARRVLAESLAHAQTHAAAASD